jgi:superfamily II DNA/RNA helicase
MVDNAKTAAQIIVTTHGKLEQLLGGRKSALDLAKLKAIVVDEADVFFLDDKNHQSLKKIANHKSIKDNEKLQWILFSATFQTEDEQRFELVQ